MMDNIAVAETAPALRVDDREYEILMGVMDNHDLLSSLVHGRDHIEHMLLYATMLMKFLPCDPQIVKYACLLHDAGRIHDAGDPEHPARGAVVAKRYFAIMHQSDAGVVDVDEVAVCNIIRRHGLTDKAQTNEEALVRAADRLDLWRLDGFAGVDRNLVDCPGWEVVQVVAKYLRTGKE
jgi:HD superfamily phosphodiesterase